MSRRHDTIEKVDAVADGIGNVERRANTHQIPGFVRGHCRQQMFEHADSFFFGLADGKPADRVTIESDVKEFA